VKDIHTSVRAVEFDEKDIYQNRNDGAAPWRGKLYDVIFLAETPAGKLFDIVLIGAILLSVAVVMLDSVEQFALTHRPLLRALEWLFTVLFSIEYVLRLLSVRNKATYALSFYGLIDLFAVLPTYISLILPGSQYMVVIRALRVLRVFRILKLAQYMGEASVLLRALRASRYKIVVFMFTVLAIVLIVGSAMYLIEGSDAGFTSIPRGVYWAIVTLTTVGYGDISPQTPWGQTLASLVMIMGYAIIAVPTGIVTVELAQAAREGRFIRQCSICGSTDHDVDARYCKHCAGALEMVPR
jgi:voltage-gated potassium channel